MLYGKLIGKMPNFAIEIIRVNIFSLSLHKQ